MRFDNYYLIKGNKNLINNDELDISYRNYLTEPVVFGNAEGGKNILLKKDYELVVKILFLISLNQSEEDSFILDSPISLDFFDRWWTIEKCNYKIECPDVLGNVNMVIKNRIKSTGNSKVDNFFNGIERYSGNGNLSKNLIDYPKYRIYKGTDVIGWLEDVVWDWDKIEGTFTNTINEAGKVFKQKYMQYEISDVEIVIEGSHFTPAIMNLSGNKAKIKIQRKYSV